MSADQATLDEFDPAATDDCQAIADDTGEQCERDPIPGLGVCHFHLDERPSSDADGTENTDLSIPTSPEQ